VNEAPEELIYLYGIVPAGSPAPTEELRGLEDRQVVLLPVGRIAAVVGAVPVESYTDEALNARLDDLDWVGARGLAHERVLDWFADQGPVIPLSLFSLHRDPERVVARLSAEAASFERVLERLRGRKEWGIKLWRRDAVAREGIDGLSPSLGRLSAEIDAAQPGRRFLLEKKRETMRDEEVRTVSKRLAHDFFGSLKDASVAGVALQIPPPAAGAERVLLLHAAFLVDDERFAAFQQTVDEQAGALVGSGFEVEFTGPWPPYHFSAPDE
jgi:hypothetical protein